MHILHIDSGLFPGQSISRQLSEQLVARLVEQNPGSRVSRRDLIAQAPAHLDATLLGAAAKPPAERSAFEKEQLALSQNLLDELFAADTVVIGAPMYNFGIPSQLKAWVDRIAQAGVTFRYTAEGPEGLLKGKKAYILSSRGGIYSEGPAAAFEHQESYLRTVLGFVGITDVQVIRAEGVNLGEDAKAQALAQASRAIATVDDVRQQAAA
ncbi:MAG TPA: FMN-dependent NADH-azoreductase [Hyphomicrobiales bacterium]|nr:FMN-dependent NADH-azoreductase [Hyphomicrobiales bacterium]